MRFSMAKGTRAFVVGLIGAGKGAELNWAFASSFFAFFLSLLLALALASSHVFLFMFLCSTSPGLKTSFFFLDRLTTN